MKVSLAEFAGDIFLEIHLNRISKALAFACLLLIAHSASAVSQPMMLISLDPIRPSGSGTGEWVTIFEELEDFGLDPTASRVTAAAARWIRGTPRIVPAFAHLEDGHYRLEPMDAKSQRDAGGNDPCLGAFFCAFQLSDSDVVKIKEGAKLIFLWQKSESPPSSLALSQGSSVFETQMCATNHLCLLSPVGEGDLAGEVIIQEGVAADQCLPKNSAYLQQLFIATQVSNRKLVDKRRSENELNPQGHVPPPVVLGANGEAISSPANLEKMRHYVSCVMPNTLTGLVSLLTADQQITELNLISALAFKTVDQLSKTNVRVELSETSKAHLDKLGEQAVIQRKVTIEREVDLGDLVCLLQEIYERNVRYLVTVQSIGNTQMGLIENDIDGAREWTAPLLLPVESEGCERLAAQWAQRGWLLHGAQRCEI